MRFLWRAILALLDFVCNVPQQIDAFPHRNAHQSNHDLEGLRARDQGWVGLPQVIEGPHQRSLLIVVFYGLLESVRSEFLASK